MSTNRVTITVGVNTKEGLGLIMPLSVIADMGDHGRPQTPMEIFIADKTFSFSYANKKTGNVIYREQ